MMAETFGLREEAERLEAKLTSCQDRSKRGEGRGDERGEGGWSSMAQGERKRGRDRS